MIKEKCVCPLGKIDDLESENCLTLETILNDKILAYYPLNNSDIDLINN